MASYMLIAAVKFPVLQDEMYTKFKFTYFAVAF